ncbi:MAG TPA: 50S ribosomal protein L17 [Candidatus Krumholzibacteria bacterium]|nr:50S ribosomal protein L17 [Candidatus Krumholzibacteria bacterium]
MRHRVDHRKLGRTAAHRRALMRSMVTSLFQTERITTTGPKAKEARRVAERLITRAKKGYRAHQEGMSLKSSGQEAEAQRSEATALAHWRQAGRFVRSTTVLRKLFDELAPLYLERNGGYTRIIRLDQNRVGDNARLVLLELVDTEITKKPLMRGIKKVEAEPEKPAKGRKARAKAKPADAEAAAAEEKPKKKARKEKAASPEKSATKSKDKKDAKKSPGGGKKTASKAKATPKTKSKKSG